MMVFDAVTMLISQYVDGTPSAIRPEHTLRELSIDSLDTVELLINLEDELNIEIELTEKLVTVGDMVRFIQRNCIDTEHHWAYN